jgi:hypothetical protein
MFSFPLLEMKTAEVGSRTLSRFGVADEQIYLVIRDRFPISRHLQDYERMRNNIAW